MYSLVHKVLSQQELNCCIDSDSAEDVGAATARGAVVESEPGLVWGTTWLTDRAGREAPGQYLWWQRTRFLLTGEKNPMLGSSCTEPYGGRLFADVLVSWPGNS